MYANKNHSEKKELCILYDGALAWSKMFLIFFFLHKRFK